MISSTLFPQFYSIKNKLLLKESAPSGSAWPAVDETNQLLDIPFTVFSLSQPVSFLFLLFLYSNQNNFLQSKYPVFILIDFIV